MKRWLIALGACLVLVGLLAGHVWFWYAPRARPARPDPESRVAALLADAGFPAALWLPFPHQNLGALDPAAADHQAFLAALARLSGLPPPVLPSFGGFPVVPSSELALAADASGGRFVVMAQVYPGLAMFSRLAGRLADNPWLAGGPVVVQGQAAEVRWDGDLWVVQSAQAARDQVASSREPVDASKGSTTGSSGSDRAATLGLLAVHRSVEPFPAGLYRLEGDAASVRVTSARELSPSLWGRARALSQDDLVLLIMAGAGSDRGVQSLAFFRRAASSSDLPRAATLIRLDSAVRDPWRVPGAGLARLAGALREGAFDGWRIRAIGDQGLASAQALASSATQVAAVAKRAESEPDAPGIGEGGIGEGGPASADGALAWGLWADLGNTYDEVARLARLAEKVPLIPRRDARRWRDAATVLAPVSEHFESLILVATESPTALRLELSRRPAPAVPRSTVPSPTPPSSWPPGD